MTSRANEELPIVLASEALIATFPSSEQTSVAMQEIAVSSDDLSKLAEDLNDLQYY